jgi:sRNA-binding protein
MSAARRVQAMRSAAVIERFERLWPKCFALCAPRRRPLKIGIDKDLIEICRPAIAKGIITIADIMGTPRVYTGADGYLRNMRTGTGRLDLNGKIVGVVTGAEAAHARQVLKLHKAARRANYGPACTKNGPRTVGTANGPISTKVMCHEKSTPKQGGRKSARVSPTSPMRSAPN